MTKQTRRDFLACSGLGALGMITGGSSVSGSGQHVTGKTNPGTYQFTRKIPVGDVYDLVVAGGGPAGSAAAISAARLGAKVLLVEASGCLGGTGTTGLVTAFNPMTNGKEMIVGGLMKEIIETLYHRGFLAPDINPDSWQKVNFRGFKGFYRVSWKDKSGKEQHAEFYLKQDGDGELRIKN